jgi:catechol 2,3-dioxygenase-like lactoylglutathione lyase family enzyme
MADQRGFGLSAIGQIAVNAHDLERATIFYREQLGMKHLFSVPNMVFLIVREFGCWSVFLKPRNSTIPVPSFISTLTIFKLPSRLSPSGVSNSTASRT